MKTKFNISFKNRPRETGLAGIGSSRYADIKVNKIEIGYVSSPNWRVDKWTLLLRVQDSNSLGWRNAVFNLKENPADMDAAKTYIKENLQKILEHNKLTLFMPTPTKENQ